MATTGDVHADVVVVGSGVAGGHAAFRLAQKGAKVLLLEAGPRLSRQEAVANFTQSTSKGPNSPYPSQPYAPHPGDDYDAFYVQAGPQQFIGSYARIFGGTTWHWTGVGDRLRPTDFQMRTHYGVGLDWPITYSDLESYYETAESMWGVAGDEAYDWGCPRRTPHPLPPIPGTYLDQMVDKALAKLGLNSRLFTHARNSVDFDGRPACCGSNTCVPICPIQAKYDGSIHSAKAEALGAQVMAQALATRIETDDERQVTGIRVRRPDGSEFLAAGKYYVIACHAIETPRLLLNSKSERNPAGVANSSDAVGRYLLSLLNQDSWGLTKDPVFPYRGPQQTSGIIEFRDGDFRRDYAAVGTSFMNSGWVGSSDAVRLSRTLARNGARGHAIISGLRNDVARHLRLNSSAEILPDPSNRIDLDGTQKDSAGVPRPRIHFSVDDYTKEGLRRSLEVNKKIFAALDARDVQWNTPYLSTAIIAGTTRMGTDAKSSVVDPFLRSHDHSNLFITGTSTHVTSPVNAPTLTVAANALRVADTILADLQKG